MPEPLAVLRLQANKIAFLAQRVDTLAVHRRRAAEVAAGRADLRGPRGLAGVALQGEDVRLQPPVAERVDALARDADAGVALADVGRFPHQRRPSLWPGFEQPRFGGHVVAVGPAELRPVRGSARRRQRDGDDKCEAGRTSIHRQRLLDPEDSVRAPSVRQTLSCTSRSS